MRVVAKILVVCINRSNMICPVAYLERCSPVKAAPGLTPGLVATFSGSRSQTLIVPSGGGTGGETCG